MHWIPYIESDGETRLQFSLPQRWWTPEEGAGMGDEDASAARVPVSYFVTWDQACGVTLRFTDDEYEDVMATIRRLMQDKSRSFRYAFDSDVDESVYTVYLETPRITDRVRPTRDTQVPWVWELHLVIRSVDSTPIFQNIKQLEETLSGSIMLLYVPGGISVPSGHLAVSRPSVATYRTAVNRLGIAIASELRNNHYEQSGVNGPNARSLLLEGARTQLIDTPQAPSSWTNINGAPFATGLTDPWGGNEPAGGHGAIDINDTSAVTSTGKEVVVPFVSTGAKSFIVAISAMAGNHQRIIVRDTTSSVNRIIITVTFTASSPTPPTLAITSGAGRVYAASEYIVGPDGVAWNLIRFTANSVDHTHTNVLQVLSGLNDAALSRFLLAGANAWDDAAPATWQRTSGVRATDSSLNFNLPAFIPQTATIYLRFKEYGSLFIPNARYFHLGNSAGTGAKLYLESDGNPAGFTTLTLDNGAATVTVVIQHTVLIANGWTHNANIELRIVIRPQAATRQMHAYFSIGGGAEVTTDSGLVTHIALPVAWSLPTMRIGGRDDNNNGGIALYAAKIMLGEQDRTAMREGTNY